MVNLSELNPKITSESIVPHLLSTFEEVYNGKASEVAFGEIISRPEVKALYENFASDEWKYGRWRTFTAQHSAQFDWGGVELQLTVDQEHGVVTDVQISSDALDLAALDEARRRLIGASTSVALTSGNPILKDIFSLIYG